MTIEPSGEPDIVDLRSISRPPEAADPALGQRRSTVLGTMALLVLALGIGFVAGSIFGADGSTPTDEEAQAEPTPPLVASIEDVNPSGPTPAPSPAANFSSGSPSIGFIDNRPSLPKPISAGLIPLPGADALEAPLRLVPGIGGDLTVTLAADGTVSVVVGTDRNPAFDVGPDGPVGFPLAAVADGLIYSPTEYALGAVAFWRRGQGVGLPIPDEPYRTSFLSARGELAVFLSAGEIIVRDLRAFTDIARLDAESNGDQIAEVWVSPDLGSAALVTTEGVGRVVALNDPATPLESFTTTTDPRVVAWLTPSQLAFVAEVDGEMVVRVLNLETSALADIAILEPGTNWRLVATVGSSDE